jgi:hypothetical protein
VVETRFRELICTCDSGDERLAYALTLVEVASAFQTKRSGAIETGPSLVKGLLCFKQQYMLVRDTGIPDVERPLRRLEFTNPVLDKT